ncbi:MAG: BatD family protein [Chitinophagales bacterium]|nr:BatD family protein [Chitinophagales bacterium]
MDMHKTWYIAFILFFFSLSANSQQLIVKVSMDTLYADDYLSVEFTLNNLEGNFITPDFSDWKIISGPNTSSSFTMINGVTSQKKTFSYVLQPKNSGTLYLGSIAVGNESISIASQPIPIVVLHAENKRVQLKVQPKTFTYADDTPTQSSVKSKRVLKKF